jgi:hypothetical protein
MFASIQRTVFLAAIGVAVLAVSHSPGSQNQQDDNAPAVRARFQSVPVTTPQSAPSYAPGYANPYLSSYGWGIGGLGYGAALSGAADVINAQGQFMLDQQQAFMGREQYFQAKIDTRHKNVQEYLYERNVLPTEEDDRERLRLETIRRARNDPPATEIWSGKALNDMLQAIQKQRAQGVQGPEVAIDQDALKHLNLSGNQTLSSIGLLRDGGKLPWPAAFLDETFNDERKNLDQLAGEVMRQIDSGAADGGTIAAMKRAEAKLAKGLKANVDSIAPNDYIEAKRFLNDLDGTFRALQDPNVGKYASGKWAAMGRTVGDLVTEMTRQGLKFAPALAGDNPAYTAIHTALVAYYLPPEQTHRWDAVAK